MSFAQALNSVCVKVASTCQGENGALQYKSAASSDDDFDGLLSEVFLIMRNSSEPDVTIKLNNLKPLLTSQERLIKLVKLVLYMRQPRAGKGEKLVFYYMLQWFWVNYNSVGKFIVNHLGDFGYYGDFEKLYELYPNNDFRQYLVTVLSERLKKDNELYETDKNKISLAAKWAPRESSHKEMAHAVAKYIFPSNNVKYTFMTYRKMLTKLNKHLHTVQTFMCDKKWKDIDFNLVPSVTMTKLSRAFQNLSQSPYKFGSSAPTWVSLPRTRGRKTTYSTFKPKKFVGPRHNETSPDYEDRNQCKEHLITFLKDPTKVKAKVTNLANIVSNYFNGREKDDIWEAQWTARTNELKKYSPDIFPMVDLSSSMNGDPMTHAITLGLFTSMIQTGEYANKFLSFNSRPVLVQLPESSSLYDKMEIMRDWSHSGRWGGNTNIQAAFDLILDIAVKHNVAADKMPKILAIFSDMQFDDGDSTWNETSFEVFDRKFKEKGYTLPFIIFWNLRGDTRGYQVKANQPNSCMLSGYSTRMMDLFLSGAIDELKQETPTQQSHISTLTLMNKVFEHEMFKDVEEELNKVVSTAFGFNMMDMSRVLFAP